jgi:hypothetical protein
MRRFSEMALVIVAALVFLSAAFTIRPAFPVAIFTAASSRPPSVSPADRGLTAEHGVSLGYSAPVAPAGPVLAPVPDPPRRAPDLVKERGRMPHLSDSRLLRL